MIFYELSSDTGTITASNFKACPNFTIFLNNSEESREEKGMSYVFRRFPHGTVKIIATDKDKAFFVRGKQTNKVAEAYSQLILLIKDIEDKYKGQYDLLSHNLITTHSRLQDMLWAIIPERLLVGAENHAEQLDIVKSRVLGDIDHTTSHLLSAVKRTKDMHAQIQGVKLLSGDREASLDRHSILGLLENLIYPYFEDFDKRNIRIKIHVDGQRAEKEKILLDYELFNIAMHHLLNNTLKYAMPGSTVHVDYDFDRKMLSFNMKSVRIDQDELNEIFEFKVRGRNAQLLSKSGEGIGMGMVKRALDLLSAVISVIPNYDDVEFIKETPFTRNKFIIIFK